MLVEKYVDLKTVYTPTDIQADMLRIHGISLTYMQAWRGKKKAFETLRGDPAESYGKIPTYLYILEKTYPGTIVNYKKTDENHFLYSFTALDASIRGWEYCRPIVVVDGTHLKSTYEGTMLIASTLDPGGHILPLAYGIVDSENDDSWLWFFENFKNAFGEREDMCFVSDRNKSIWNATTAVYPEFRHYACIYHLWTNLLKKTYRDTEEVRPLFFSLAKAYTVQEFDELMTRMDQINPKYCAYLQKAKYEKWSRAHSPVKRTWTLTSNIAESLNNAILVGRRLPVVPLLEFV
ncbi:protein FAR1-RELATED SEQUENCE 4-like [Solanum verrucosum]|uniref:protein FAR1-RELATED SEQUENCE 4-like n=1 Tax=Solanum verrucosum TaxID=315347 RepID=UPI0020D16AEA|nr:protein FAR1-RELATED SEQUENCE 4-like [Solanum verrucosum]